MKIVFLGTPSFVVPVLENLAKKHEILAVFCQPDKPGNRNKITISPVKSFALENNIQIFTPNKIDDEVVLSVKNLKPDLMVCCAYGKILPQNFIDICPILNIHPSDLPKYRGSSPVQWALINGEKNIAVSIMKLTFKMDSGDILLKRKINVEENDNAETLLKKSFLLGTEMLDVVLDDFKKYYNSSEKQDEGKASVYPMLKKEDGKIDFSMDAKSIENLIRGVYLWPVAHCLLNGKNLKIFRAKAFDENKRNESFGEVIKCDKFGIIVSCGTGFLDVEELQLEGSKKLTAREFANGNQMKVGDFLC